MEDLIKKLEKLIELSKALKIPTSSGVPKNSAIPKNPVPKLPKISLPGTPTQGGGGKPTNLPGPSPTSNKDPKKIAQQIKNAEKLKQTMPTLKSDNEDYSSKPSRKEKITTGANGQWSLDEKPLEKAKKKSKFQQVQDGKSKYQKFQEMTEMMPDKNLAALREEANKPRNPDEHKPEHWGRVIKIDPKDIAHYSQFPDNHGETAYHGTFGYDYCRDTKGRVYQKAEASGPDYGHLNGKYFPTNIHESEDGEGPGKLTGAFDTKNAAGDVIKGMGVMIPKKGPTLH